MWIRIFMIAWLMAMCCGTAQAQRAQTKVVTGEYLLVLTADLSPKEAEAQAIQEAKNNALAKAFGVRQSNQDVRHLVEEGGQVEDRFDSFSASEVMGEWVETQGQPEITRGYDEALDAYTIHVRIKGVVRAVQQADVDLKVQLLRHESDQSESLSFVHEEPFFLSFKSPAKGYLLVYLVDGNGQANCLLPYPDQDNGHVAVKANEKYLFFSCAKSPKDLLYYTQEYQFTTDKAVEQNRLFVLFSTRPIVKACDEQQEPGGIPTLAYDDFYRWLGHLKLKSKAPVQIIEKTVEVRRR